LSNDIGTIMNATLVLTVTAPDQAGLIKMLAETVAAHDGNWLASRVSRLAGRLAGIVLVEAPPAQVATLTEALQGLSANGLQVQVENASAAPTDATDCSFYLSLVGQDHPGIVRDIARTLGTFGVNIAELSTECSSASWSGETLFYADAQLRVPAQVAIDELCLALESLANEIMVDITLDDNTTAPAPAD